MRMSLLVRLGLILPLSLGVSACSLDELLATLKGNETETKNKEEVVTQTEEPIPEPAPEAPIDPPSPLPTPQPVPPSPTEVKYVPPIVNSKLPAIPKNVTASVTGYEISIQWDAAAQADFYYVNWSTDANFNDPDNTRTQSTGPDSTRFQLHLTEDQTLFIRVSAVNVYGQSEKSNIVTVNTHIATALANANIARGGVLYDKWWQLDDNIATPTETNPNWPGDINDKVTGAQSWQCVNCHGWDYLGDKGINASGDDYTGSKGLLGLEALIADPTFSYQFIRSSQAHKFTQEQIPEQNILDLIAFIWSLRNSAEQQTIPDKFYSDKTLINLDKANTQNGETLYSLDTNADSCDSCHTAVDLGKLATQNPWEFLHKMRFGDIDASNLSAELIEHSNIGFYNVQGAIDILAYVQTQTNAYQLRAGRLYDNWAVESNIGTAPQETNPIWTASGNTKKTGATTWRCNSCHGWDYLGAAGAHGDTTSNYYTGIKGLTTLNRTAIFDFIKGGDSSFSAHNFGEFLGDSDIKLLVDFVQLDGVHEFEQEFVVADNEAGEDSYTEHCGSCHGENAALQAASLVDIAATNPTELLHKARFGHPSKTGSETYRAGVDKQTAVNIIKYLQTSASYIKADIARGGRLYDNWWEEMGATDDAVLAPAYVNPLWELRNSNIPDLAADKKTTYSWRCKTCHGWDYEGIGFNSGTKSPFGADNLVYKMELIVNSGQTRADQRQQIFDWIKLGASPSLHNFSSINTALPTLMSDVEIWDLTKFLFKGVIDTDKYLYETFKFVKAPYRNPTNGQGLYYGTVDPTINCAFCHSDDGRGIAGKGTDTVDLFALAADDPWAFLHKTRVGQPNTPMPAFLDPTTDRSTIDALHVLDFAQQEFLKRP